MGYANPIKQMIEHAANLQVNSVSFRPGQIIFGKVIRLYPNQTAEVQVGQQKIIAQLEAPLSANERYLFQVQSGQEKVTLKVLAPSAGSSGSPLPLDSILNRLSLPAGKENQEIIRFFLKEQLPITKETMTHASDWLKNIKPIEKGLEAVKEMIARNLPFTKEVFSALFSVQNAEPIPALIEKLGTLLTKHPVTDTGNRLQGKLQDMTAIDTASMKWDNSAFVIHHIKQTIRSLGLSYENDLFTQLQMASGEEPQTIETLKPLLMLLLQEQPPDPLKEAAEQLLQRITGLQLLSQELGPLQQLILQIPIPLSVRTAELNMQWSGRKTSDGKIDPNYCRVLFYLELEHLHETVVDMQVQNRVLTIAVMNENDLKMFAKPFLKPLKEKLAEMNYHLSSLTFHQTGDITLPKTQALSFPCINDTKTYNGVDIRI